MKRNTLICLLLAISLLAAGCGSASQENPDTFTFSHSWDDTVYKPGDTVVFTVTAVNIGKAFTYIGTPSFHPAELAERTGNITFTIHSQEEAIPTDATEYTWQTGQEKHHTYSFEIPDNAMTGSYDVTVSLFGTTKVFRDVIKVEGS